MIEVWNRPHLPGATWEWFSCVLCACARCRMGLWCRGAAPWPLTQGWQLGSLGRNATEIHNSPRVNPCWGQPSGFPLSLSLIRKRSGFLWGGRCGPRPQQAEWRITSRCGCCVICLSRGIWYLISIFMWDPHMLNPERLPFQAKPSWWLCLENWPSQALQARDPPSEHAPLWTVV